MDSLQALWRLPPWGLPRRLSKDEQRAYRQHHGMLADVAWITNAAQSSLVARIQPPAADEPPEVWE